MDNGKTKNSNPKRAFPADAGEFVNKNLNWLLEQGKNMGPMGPIGLMGPMGRKTKQSIQSM